MQSTTVLISSELQSVCRREGQPVCEIGDSAESFVSSFIYFRNTNSE